MGVERHVPHPGHAAQSFQQAVTVGAAQRSTDAAFSRLPEAARNWAAYTLLEMYIRAALQPHPGTRDA